MKRNQGMLSVHFVLLPGMAVTCLHTLLGDKYMEVKSIEEHLKFNRSLKSYFVSRVRKQNCQVQQINWHTYQL